MHRCACDWNDPYYRNTDLDRDMESFPDTQVFGESVSGFRDKTSRASIWNDSAKCMKMVLLCIDLALIR